MRLTARDKKILTLMCNLACDWEQSLAMSNEPAGDFTPNEGQKETIRRCEANVRRFRALYDKLATK